MQEIGSKSSSGTGCEKTTEVDGSGEARGIDYISN
jgi:hypothetical protein